MECRISGLLSEFLVPMFGNFGAKNMKTIRIILLLGALLSFTACNTSHVQTQLDLSAPMTASILNGDNETQPDLASQTMIIKLLRDWLPEMRTTISTYPTPTYRIKLSGTRIDGSSIEEALRKSYLSDQTGLATELESQRLRTLKHLS
jgi:hypothetical protein